MTAQNDASGMPFVYTDESTCTYSPCNDDSEPQEDSDANGNFTYCANDDNGETPDTTDDIIFGDADTDELDLLDTENETYNADSSPTQVHLRHLRIYIRKRNPAFWRHIRNLYHKGAALEAIQEMLNYEQNNPPSPPLPN